MNPEELIPRSEADRLVREAVERLKNDVKRYSEMSLQYMSQIQELRSLLERAKKFAEHYAHTASDSDEGDFRVREANNFIKGYERMKGKQ